jgi:hypothetical protein
MAQSRYPPGDVHGASHTRQVDAMNGHEDQQGNVYDELKMLGTSNCARLVPAKLRYSGLCESKCGFVVGLEDLRPRKT